MNLCEFVNFCGCMYVKFKSLTSSEPGGPPGGAGVRTSTFSNLMASPLWDW